MRPMKEIAEEAIEIQNVVNLTAVVRCFMKAIEEVRLHLRAEGKEGTDAVNMHPVCLMYSSKIASLTYSESPTEFARAYDWCKEASK